MADSSPPSTPFVEIPCDTSNPLKERSFQLDTSSAATGGSYDHLVELLESWIVLLQPGERVDMDLIRAQVAPKEATGCKGGMCPHVSYDTMQQAAEQGVLQVVAVRNGSDRTSDDGCSSASARATF
jgi:hypothetical protein